MNDLTLLDLFLNELWIGKGLSPNTVQSYRLDLTALCDWLGERKLSCSIWIRSIFKLFLVSG